MAGRVKHSRRIEQKRKRRLERLESKSEFGLHGSGDFHIGPPGVEKMSDVLDDFVGPFIPETGGIADIRGLYGLGVVAWNTALLPEEKQQAALDAAISRMGPDAEAVLHTYREFLNQLIRRKQKYFASNRRAILRFEVYQTGEDYQLNVMSTVDQ
jgi:hypothetical protein